MASRLRFHPSPPSNPACPIKAPGSPAHFTPRLTISVGIEQRQVPHAPHRDLVNAASTRPTPRAAVRRGGALQDDLDPPALPRTRRLDPLDRFDPIAFPSNQDVGRVVLGQGVFPSLEAAWWRTCSRMLVGLLAFNLSGYSAFAG